jgi:hypothetical protein
MTLSGREVYDTNDTGRDKLCIYLRNLGLNRKSICTCTLHSVHSIPMQTYLGFHIERGESRLGLMILRLHCVGSYALGGLVHNR